jgi:lysophospholipase L1-like esterase
MVGAPQLVRAIALAAGSVGGLTGAAFGLLSGQSKRARSLIVDGPPVLPFNADGIYHPDGQGPFAESDLEPLNLAVFGDSLAAGLGADSPETLPGVMLARGLARETGLPTRLTTHAISGSRTFDLQEQVDRAMSAPPDLALVIIGGNDVAARSKISHSVQMLGQQVRRLKAAGTKVVVGTCPDLGVSQVIPQPLRELARQYSRALSRAQHQVLHTIGAAAVSLFDLVSPDFHVRPHELFSADRFHPNGAGYRLAVNALLPALTAAAQLFSDGLPVAA